MLLDLKTLVLSLIWIQLPQITKERWIGFLWPRPATPPHSTRSPSHTTDVPEAKCPRSHLPVMFPKGEGHVTGSAKSDAMGHRC